MKVVCDDLANIRLDSERLKAFSNMEMEPGCLLLPFLFNILLEMLIRATRQEKEIVVIQIGKQEI